MTTEKIIVSPEEFLEYTKNALKAIESLDKDKKLEMVNDMNIALQAGKSPEGEMYENEIRLLYQYSVARRELVQIYHSVSCEGVDEKMKSHVEFVYRRAIYTFEDYEKKLKTFKRAVSTLRGTL